MITERTAAKEALADLGYRDSGGTYIHGENQFTVEFPPGPLAIGDDLINTWETLTRNNELLHIIPGCDSRLECARG